MTRVTYALQYSILFLNSSYLTGCKEFNSVLTISHIVSLSLRACAHARTYTYTQTISTRKFVCALCYAEFNIGWKELLVYNGLVYNTYLIVVKYDLNSNSGPTLPHRKHTATHTISFMSQYDIILESSGAIREQHELLSFSQFSLNKFLSAP